MEDNRTLYPLGFGKIQFDRPWGKDVFKLADLGFRDSLIREGWLAGNTMGEIMETYLDRVVGERCYDFYGRQFPICIREMEVDSRTPLQVHPDDETASQRFDFLGKSKLWYVLDAKDGAGLGIGFKSGCNAGTFFDLCCNGGDVDGLLNFFPAVKGACYLIPAGVPHFAGGKLRLLEISESSPMDFCMYNWGMTVDEEEFDSGLSPVEALDFIDYSKFEPHKAEKEMLVKIPQFTVRKIQLRDTLKLSGDGESDGFVLYYCLSGAAAVQFGSEEEGGHVQLKSGDVLLVPAECTDYVLLPAERDTELLEITNEMQESDSYINLDVPERLPDDE